MFNPFKSRLGEQLNEHEEDTLCKPKRSVSCLIAGKRQWDEEVKDFCNENNPESKC